MRVGDALFGNANKVGVHIYPDVVHPRPDRRHPCRAAAHEGVDDRIAGLCDEFQKVRQQGHRLDAKMEVPAHLLGLVVGRLVRARLRIHWTKRQGISAKFAFPIRGLIVSKNGRARLTIAEGVLGAQPARAPLCDTRLVCATVGLLAGNDDSLMSGHEARVHLIIQRLGRRQTIRVVPDPDAADFKPGFLQISRKPVLHIRKTEHSDMRTGLQHPEKFYPYEKVRQNQIPADFPDLLSIWWINDTTIDTVAGHPRQSVESIVRNQVGFGSLGRSRGGWRPMRKAGRRLSGTRQYFLYFQGLGRGHRMSFFQFGLPIWRRGSGKK